jgi:hypothetical protein
MVPVRGAWEWAVGQKSGWADSFPRTRFQIFLFFSSFLFLFSHLGFELAKLV